VARTGYVTSATSDWTSWNSAYADSTTSSGDITWCAWNSITVSATTNATIEVWQGWVDAQGQQHWQRSTPAPETEEQRQAREARAAERQAELQRQAEERQAAEARAEELLVAHLKPAQKKSYREGRYFEVLTGDRRRTRRYRVKHGWAGNVEELDEQGRPVARYCIHPRDTVPIPDNLLAQKFLLETNEQEFLRIANRTPLAVGA
jgi:hypothetical protein